MSGYRIGPHGLLRCQSKSRNRSNKSCRAAPSLTRVIGKSDGLVRCVLIAISGFVPLPMVGE